MKKGNILLFFLAVVSAIVFTPFFGALYKIVYENFFGGKIDQCLSITVLCFSHPEYFNGFFLSYFFFVTLFSVFIGGKNRYKIGAALLLPMFILFLGAWGGLIINFFALVVFWVIAEAAFFIKRLVIKK